MSIPKGWKYYPYGSPFHHRVRTYLDAGGKLDLRVLARSWLRELSYVGLQEVDHSSGALPKGPSNAFHSTTDALREDIHPLKLEGSREVVWINLNGQRSKWGYRMTQVLSAPLKSDVAVLGAVTALEAQEVEADSLEDALIDHVIDVWNEWPERSQRPFELSEEESKDFDKVMDEMDKHAAESEEPYGSRYDHPARVLEYVVGLLRHYRPEFDDLAREEQRGLVRGGCKRVTKYVKSLRELSAFLEYGVPEGDLRPKVEDAEKIIMAAELQDVEGLSSVKLGEVLGIAPPPSDLVKRTNSTARAMAKRGRRLLESNLGEDAWRALVEAKRAERDRFLSLSKGARDLVAFAENTGTPIEEIYVALDDEDAKE